MGALPAIVTLDTPSLGDRSYLVHDAQVGFVVDPQRDIDRVLEAAGKAGVAIRHVFETHMHNDYVTGGLALAKATGASYHVNAADQVAYQRSPISGADVVTVSPAMRMRAVETPGHTYTHLSYVLEYSGEPVAVFTGGSLLFGTMGRPDLLGPDHTERLVHRQFASAQRLAEALPERTQVLPTHGFGSFCSPGSAGGVTASTIGQEKRINPALTADEDRWVAATLASLDAFPAYYAHMAPLNSAGPTAPDLSPPERADKETLARRIGEGEWVVDLRSCSAFCAGHVPGTFNFGLDGAFSTYVGWLMPWGSPLTLLGSTPQEVAEAQRELARIGIDRLRGAATGTAQEWTDAPLGTLQRAAFADLAQVRHHRPVTVLDVRLGGEFADAHITGALGIPVHELLTRSGDLPPGETWVHCATGYRASIAASVLAAAGVHVIVIDDDFEKAEAAGLPMTMAS